MIQPAAQPFLSRTANHPPAAAGMIPAGAIGEIHDVGNLGKPVPLDLLAAVEGECTQRAAMERSVEAKAIAVIFFVVIADFDGVLHRLGPGVGEKSGAKPEL